MLIMTSQAEVSDLSSEANSSGRRDDVANCGTGGRANPGDKPCLSLMGWTLNGQSLAQLRFFLPLDPLKRPVYCLYQERSFLAGRKCQKALAGRQGLIFC